MRLNLIRQYNFYRQKQSSMYFLKPKNKLLNLDLYNFIMSIYTRQNQHKPNTLSFSTARDEEDDDFKDFFTTDNSFLQEKFTQPSFRSNIKMKRNLHKIEGGSTSTVNNEPHKPLFSQIDKLKSIINSGKYIYMNVLGSDENHVRAVSPEQFQNNQQSNETTTFFGCQYPHLTNEEKQVINYLNTEHQTKAIEHQMKSLIKDKFIRINQSKKQNINAINQVDKANTINSVEKNGKINKQIPMTSRPRKKILTQQSKRNFVVKSTENHTLKEKFNSNLTKIFRDTSIENKKEQIDIKNTSLVRNNNISEAQEIKRWIREHRSLGQKTSKISDAEYKLENLQKYNIQFIDYLKKKSDRKIQTDKIKKLISKKENIIEKYQQHLLQQIQLQPKQKESIRKCFEEINNEARRLIK